MKKYLLIVLFVGVWSCSRDAKTSKFNNDVNIENNHYNKRTLESYEIIRHKFGDSLKTLLKNGN